MVNRSTGLAVAFIFPLCILISILFGVVVAFSFSTAPASPPTDVSAMSTSPTLIEVMWNEVPAIDQNGIITMYEVMYTPQNTFGGQISTNTTNVSGSELMVTLPYLQEYVNYSISVRAYTSAGQGPESTVIELTQEAGKLANEYSLYLH